MVAVVVSTIALRSAEAFREDLNVTDPADPPRDLDDLDAPRDVYVAIAVSKAGSLDEAAGNFWWDFYVYFSWRDDRQAEGSFEADGKVWWPHPEIMNFVGDGRSTKGEYICQFSEGSPGFTLLAIRDGMWGFCQARHQAVLDADLGLNKFPFDSQTVGLHLESFLHNSTYLRLVALPTVEVGLRPPGGPFAVRGWELKGIAVRSVLHTYPILSESYHQLVLTMTLQRLPDYYTSRYVVGPALLVAMSFLSLCVPSAEPDRFGCADALRRDALIACARGGHGPRFTPPHCASRLASHMHFCLQRAPPLFA
jgi:hypothetical protein